MDCESNWGIVADLIHEIMATKEKEETLVYGRRHARPTQANSRFSMFKQVDVRQQELSISHSVQLFGSSRSREFWMTYNLCVSHNIPTCGRGGGQNMPTWFIFTLRHVVLKDVTVLSLFAKFRHIFAQFPL